MLYFLRMNFKDLLNSISSTFRSTDENGFVGIDIGSSYIKIVQLKKEGGRVVLETYGEIALGPYEENGVAGQIAHLDQEKLTEAVKNLIKQANITSKIAFLSIASSSSLIFIINLPRISEHELANAVQTEVKKYIPIPLTEISLDWWIIPEEKTFEGDYLHTEKKGDIKVLVAAVRNEIFDEYEGMIKSFPFHEHSYEIETFSMIRSSLKSELAPVMLIDFGASGTRVAIVEHGVLRKFYSISRGGLYLTTSIKKSLQIEFEEAEQKKREIGLSEEKDSEVAKVIETGMEYIFSEVKRVLFDFEREYKRPVNKIILTGGAALLPKLRESMEFRYNVTTEYANPFKHSLYPDFLEEVLRNAGPEFAVAFGLAFQKLE